MKVKSPVLRVCALAAGVLAAKALHMASCSPRLPSFARARLRRAAASALAVVVVTTIPQAGDEL